MRNKLLIGVAAAIVLAVLAFLLLHSDGGTSLPKGTAASIQGAPPLTEKQIEDYVNQRAALGVASLPADCTKDKECMAVAKQSRATFVQEALWSSWTMAELKQRNFKPTKDDISIVTNAFPTLKGENKTRHESLLAFNHLMDNDIKKQVKQPTIAEATKVFNKNPAKYQSPHTRQTHIYKATNSKQVAAFKKALKLADSMPGAIAFVDPDAIKKSSDPGIVTMKQGSNHPLAKRIFAMKEAQFRFVKGPIKIGDSTYWYDVIGDDPGIDATREEAIKGIQAGLYNDRLDAAADRWHAEQLAKWRSRTVCRSGLPKEMCKEIVSSGN